MISDEIECNIILIKLMQGGSAVKNLIGQQWKTEQDYKKMIIALQLQNEKYRNELYELGETVNKILDKTKLPSSNKAPPNLDQQLELVKKELHNVNQFIEIYQKELSNLQGKKKEDQIESIAASEQLLKAKQNELAQLKREVKELSHKNKALQYRLADFGRKNRAKSFDQQALQLKELISENKNLKGKLEELEQMQEKRQVWLKNNLQNVKVLEQKVQAQETRLPKIESRKSERPEERSLPKLQSEKKILTKYLESSREKTNSKLEKELTDLEKINKMVQDKLANTQQEIADIEQQIAKAKLKVEQTEALVTHEPQEEKVVKLKEVGSQVTRRVRRSRRDWVGKFDTLRFSDSRIVREESRIFKVLFNSAGYFLFSYYAVKDPKRKFTGKLPFEPSTLQVSGKESTFTVESPDFVKNIRLKINLKTQRIIQMHVVSNLGVQGEFAVDSPAPAVNPKGKEKPLSTAKEDQLQVHYQMDVKPNEAITTVFGSYGFKADDKKNITGVWLQGIGVELIEDFVEELI